MGDLVRDAVRRASLKRGAGTVRVPFDERLAVSERAVDLVALDEALTELAKAEPRKGRVVELRYFGGLSVDESAAVLGVAPQTVMRDWKMAKLWLLRALRHSRTGANAEDR